MTKTYGWEKYPTDPRTGKPWGDLEPWEVENIKGRVAEYEYPMYYRETIEQNAYYDIRHLLALLDNALGIKPIAYPKTHYLVKDQGNQDHLACTWLTDTEKDNWQNGLNMVLEEYPHQRCPVCDGEDKTYV